MPTPTAVRISKKLSARDVFARCARRLATANGCYTTTAATYETLRWFATRPHVVCDEEEPSWEGVAPDEHLTKKDYYRVLNRARRSLACTGRRQQDGYVSMVTKVDINEHQWVQYVCHLRDRQVIKRALCR